MSRLITLIRRLRPIELLGLCFVVVMLALYWWLQQPLFSFDRIVLWSIATLIVFVVVFTTRLLVSRDPQLVFSVSALAAFVRDWIPLIIFMLVYDNLHDITHLINPQYFDSFFIVVDQILFFGTHPTLLFEQLISPLATQWFALTYSLYFLYFPVTLGILYFTKRMEAFHTTSMAVMMTVYAGFILYVLFPCVGPILSQNSIHSTDLYGGGAFSFYNAIVELYGSYRNYFHCFPSLHVAVTAVFWWSTWKYMRPLFYIYAPFVLSLWFATMYLRWHYVVDVLAGFALAGCAIFFAPRIQKAWERWRARSRR